MCDIYFVFFLDIKIYVYLSFNYEKYLWMKIFGYFVLIDINCVKGG